jgi:ABC-type branched-subunit amino acid transport system permease subunit
VSKKTGGAAAGALGIVLALLFGALASIAVTKLRNDAATIATFAMLVIVYAVAGNWTSMTGGTAHSHALQSPIVTSRGKRTSNKTAIVPGECSWKSAYCLCNKLDVVYLTI